MKKKKKKKKKRLHPKIQLIRRAWTSNALCPGKVYTVGKRPSATMRDLTNMSVKCKTKTTTAGHCMIEGEKRKKKKKENKRIGEEK